MNRMFLILLLTLAVVSCSWADVFEPGAPAGWDTAHWGWPTSEWVLVDEANSEWPMVDQLNRFAPLPSGSHYFIAHKAISEGWGSSYTYKEQWYAPGTYTVSLNVKRSPAPYYNPAYPLHLVAGAKCDAQYIESPDYPGTYVWSKSWNKWDVPLSDVWTVQSTHMSFTDWWQFEIGVFGSNDPFVGIASYSITAGHLPEPSALLVLGSGAVAMAGVVIRRRR